jgi:hypothetical protein
MYRQTDYVIEFQANRNGNLVNAPAEKPAIEASLLPTNPNNQPSELDGFLCELR